MDERKADGLLLQERHALSGEAHTLPCLRSIYHIDPFKCV